MPRSSRDSGPQPGPAPNDEPLRDDVRSAAGTCRVQCMAQSGDETLVDGDPEGQSTLTEENLRSAERARPSKSDVANCMTVSRVLASRLPNIHPNEIMVTTAPPPSPPHARSANQPCVVASGLADATGGSERRCCGLTTPSTTNRRRWGPDGCWRACDGCDGAVGG